MMTYIVETGGLRILTWGDNRHDAPEDVWAAWGHVDVMTLPVDGSEHILSFAQADAIIEGLKPKIVTPTHYLVPGVSSILSTPQGIDAWVDGKQARLPVDGARLNLAADMVAACDRHIAFLRRERRQGLIATGSHRHPSPPRGLTLGTRPARPAIAADAAASQRKDHA